MYVLKEVLYSYKNVANKSWTRYMKQANREYKSDHSPAVKQLESLWWKKKEIRTSASTKEEQLARMVTNALQVASEWPSVFMTILVSSYAPAVSTLKLWWICNVIDLFWGFPFFFTRSPRLSFCTLLSLLLSRHEQQFVNAEQTRKR